tara:strand:+ start:2083 stop:2241 length:159 start_codon:yes stop_codon:yes gene_type:complete
MEIALGLIACTLCFIAGLLMKSPFQAKAKAGARHLANEIEEEGAKIVRNVIK